MANIKKSGLKTVEADYDKYDEQRKEHRKGIAKRVFIVLGVVLVLVAAISLFVILRTFDSYEVRSSKERTSTDQTIYAQFQDYMLEYSNDGISCIGKENEIIWNQAFEMSSPQLDICGDYLVVYDEGGNELYILTKSGLQKEIKTTSIIQKARIAKQGTVAVLMKENQESRVKLFDKKGKELANGKFYAEKGSFPVDIALSHDATKLAVDMVDISSGSVATTISFYNFGSVGQSEIDNMVGTYTFKNVLIPEIDYVSDSKMVAIGTGKIYMFEGNQKPELKHEIAVEHEILSCFHNDKYIGIVYVNAGVENSWHLKLMDYRGTKIMETDISIIYDKIEFIGENEICVRNISECEIFTIYGVKKFAYKFDEEVVQILSTNKGQNYTFVFSDAIEEVILK